MRYLPTPKRFSSWILCLNFSQLICYFEWKFFFTIKSAHNFSERIETHKELIKSKQTIYFSLHTFTQLTSQLFIYFHFIESFVFGYKSWNITNFPALSFLWHSLWNENFEAALNINEMKTSHRFMYFSKESRRYQNTEWMWNIWSMKPGLSIRKNKNFYFNLAIRTNFNQRKRMLDAHEGTWPFVVGRYYVSRSTNY